MTTPKLLTDTSKFDENQIKLARWLIRIIDGELKNEKLDEETRDSLRESLAFHVAVLLDGDVVFPEGEDCPLSPELTFRLNDDTLLTPENGGSWMHEYIHGLLEDFEEAPDEDEEEDDDDEVDTAAPGASKLSLEEYTSIDVALAFASGLKLFVGYYEVDDLEEFAQNIATNLHFATTNKIDTEASVNLPISSLCLAFQHIDAIHIQFDDIDQEPIRREGLAELSSEALAKLVDGHLKALMS